jgi:hypothetical protein
LHVPNPGPSAVFNADPPALSGSGTQHHELAPPSSPIGTPDPHGSFGNAPSALIIGDQCLTMPRYTLVPVPSAPPDTAPAAHASSGDSPGCQAIPSTLMHVPCAPPAFTPASHMLSGEATGPDSDTVDGSASGLVPRSSVPLAPSPHRIRLMDEIVKPEIYKDGTIRYANLTASTKPPSRIMG